MVVTPLDRSIIEKKKSINENCEKFNIKNIA